MNYNFKKIGKRIEENRKQLGLKSADKLSEAIEEQGAYYSRQKIREWERGIDMPPDKALLIMCNLFQCDPGYLLCEYDCKTRPNTDIAEETGLSESAINNIKSIKEDNSRLLFAMNFLLESKVFIGVLMDLYEYENRCLHCSIAREEMDSSETDAEYHENQEIFYASQDSMIAWKYQVSRTLNEIIDAWTDATDNLTPEERLEKLQSFLPYAV